ncbi:Uncharacterized protein FWK35_00019722 [Aphis craccivora]|uniref:Uncharacterized protein n=1 Tax=Aphis craccivora TaxID=307492 RepID=A0A6G0Z963_APHCR|nr:Uncharacterized protein FWK35_00019722 [Aphis craccivora]
MANHVWQMPIWEPPFICSVCPVSLTSLCWSVTHTPPSSHSLRQSYADHDFWNKGVHAMILQWFNGVQMTHASRHNLRTASDQYDLSNVVAVLRCSQVKRYSYTTSNESTTSGQQLWSLERNCSGKCEDGCIVIGERIKIYACQACCESPLCNVSNGSDRRPTAPSSVVCLVFLFLLLRTFVGQLPLQPSKRPSVTHSSTSVSASSDPFHLSSDTRFITNFNKYFLILSSSYHLAEYRR